MPKLTQSFVCIVSVSAELGEVFFSGGADDSAFVDAKVFVLLKSAGLCCSVLSIEVGNILLLPCVKFGDLDVTLAGDFLLTLLMSPTVKNDKCHIQRLKALPRAVC